MNSGSRFGRHPPDMAGLRTLADKGALNLSRRFAARWLTPARSTALEPTAMHDRSEEMTFRAPFVLLFLIAFAVASCGAIPGPAAFWGTFHPELIVDHSSDQGPWGGTRSLTWRTSGATTFDFGSAAAFAQENGWKLLAREHSASSNRIPLPNGPESTEPQFLVEPSMIGRFESGWIREDPGTNETSPAYGYLQVTDDGKAMYVFHFWGNG